eukprot:3356620-Rhodomonas_salina.2
MRVTVLAVLLVAGTANAFLPTAPSSFTLQRGASSNFCRSDRGVARMVLSAPKASAVDADSKSAAKKEAAPKAAPKVVLPPHTYPLMQTYLLLAWNCPIGSKIPLSRRTRAGEAPPENLMTMLMGIALRGSGLHPPHNCAQVRGARGGGPDHSRPARGDWRR